MFLRQPGTIRSTDQYRSMARELGITALRELQWKFHSPPITSHEVDYSTSVRHCSGNILLDPDSEAGQICCRTWADTFSSHKSLSLIGRTLDALMPSASRGVEGKGRLCSFNPRRMEQRWDSRVIKVHVRRTPAQSYDHNCLLPPVKYGEGGCDTDNHIVVFCRINRNPAGDGIFESDNAPIHAPGLVQTWFDEHENELKYLPRPAQSPGFNMIKPLWSVFEQSIRNQYPPPSFSQDFHTISIKNGTLYL
ncbi:DDE_3 domain-containing protein [Trichonephila clavipes]|nr:DDE_3 domain-containing protein [Trichonephila clavipes]